MNVFTKDEQIIISHFNEKQQRIFNEQKRRASLRQAYNLAIMCDEHLSKKTGRLEGSGIEVLDIPKRPTIESLARNEMYVQGKFTVVTIRESLIISKGVETSNIYLNQICRKLQREKFIKNLGKVRHGRFRFEWVGDEPELRYFIPFEEYASQLKIFDTKKLHAAIQKNIKDCTIGQCRVAVHAMNNKGLLSFVKREGNANVWSVKN